MLVHSLANIPTLLSIITYPDLTRMEAGAERERKMEWVGLGVMTVEMRDIIPPLIYFRTTVWDNGKRGFLTSLDELCIPKSCGRIPISSHHDTNTCDNRVLHSSDLRLISR
jgi:hypothetical protein